MSCHPPGFAPHRVAVCRNDPPPTPGAGASGPSPHRFFPLLWLGLWLVGCSGIPEGLHPVRGFEVNRYLGTWYEIARLDHSFERGLTEISADYRLRDDGGIRVLNQGYDPAKGAWRTAEGRAYFVADTDTASLKVSFFGPFYGGYHVIALDRDYRWALVSGPSRNYLWILARERTLPPDILDQLIETARRAGFETDKLIFVSQGATDIPAPPQAGKAVPAGSGA